MEKSNELKVVEIKEDRIIVVDDYNGRTAIAKYEDEGGVYFFDENNEKKYITDAVCVNEYIFKTDLYDRNNQIWATEERGFYAANLDEAKKIQHRHYGDGFDRKLLDVNKFGNKQ